MDYSHYPDLVPETGKLGDALWSPDKKHRYCLTRPLAEKGPTMVICMQNPSKASADDSDPTVTRVIGFARREKVGKLIVVNMGAGVATDPKDFLKMEDPVGPRNLEFLKKVGLEADIAVGAWGALSKRHLELFRLGLGVVKKWKDLKCFGKTDTGYPRHPLYLPADAPLVSF
jgi:hypothetical protein